MKRFWEIFRTGLIAIVPLALLLFLIMTMLGFLADFLNVFDFPIFENAALNTFVKFICLAGVIFLLGLLVSWQKFRRALSRVFSKIPLVSDFVNIFFGDDYIERIKKGDFPVVQFRFSVHHPWFPPVPQAKFFGIVTHQGETSSIVFFPTTPIPFTGYVAEVENAYLVKTNLTARELFKMMVAFGLNYGEIQKQKKITPD